MQALTNQVYVIADLTKTYQPATPGYTVSPGYCEIEFTEEIGTMDNGSTAVTSNSASIQSNVMPTYSIYWD